MTEDYYVGMIAGAGWGLFIGGMLVAIVIGLFVRESDPPEQSDGDVN